MPIVGPSIEHVVAPSAKGSIPSSRAELYVPTETPPPTAFAIKCHPQAAQVCAELDDFFAKYWPWKDQKARDSFRAGQYNLWACLPLPLVYDDRVLDACKVKTLLFLLDDVVENMSVEDGKKFYRKLIPIAMGKNLPNREDAYEWITYDTWASMRACDPELTDVVLQQALVCITAQVDEARLMCKDMGALLRHRTKEAGIGKSSTEDAITKIMCVVDISGIGIKQVWNLRAYLQDLSKLFATNYPEILDRAFIIGAPSYFPTIWSWVKKWVDPNTVAKFFILTPDEVLPTLQQHINMPDISNQFGGEFDYQHGMQPSLDPVIADMLTWLPPNANFQMGLLKWVDEGKGKRAAVAVGNSEGQDRCEKIATLRSKKRSSK